MQEFLKFSDQDKHDAFQAASLQCGLPAYVVEKDFHVTVVLKCLFGPIWDQLKDTNEHEPYVFKGGTTLSKVYGVINRMSEDIDLALNMDFLGHPEPDKESRSKWEKQRKPALLDAAIKFTQQTLLNLLKKELEKLAPNSGYSVQVSADAEDALEILYPKHCDDYGSGEYIKPRVLVETGGRAAQVPKETKPVSALVGKVAQEASEEFTVSVLKIGRTFFEKITAVHAFINQNRVDERSSRHLYDIYQIFHSYPGLIHETGLLRDALSVSIIKNTSA